ncbi:ANTAR domain-containing response regulator [Pelosinus propionicus]|uniref:Response regulator receiver and ANTAR domain protein n=1 Tax=Pelosinus propionicus DSM 13327 TaxID=1123291 RepID=A0A1I4HMS8_9FIRM|nr:response regulator [Pelosinus propionicus]SFL43434.1 response regulator receiver and ANTAR domain protein [Pelosinus propionicus DSM 13327]
MKPLSILLVEDEVLIRADMREMLEKAGHRVRAECGNGEQAVRLVKENVPDLVIMDIMMPGISGLEVAQCMYSLNIPVVMVTAHSQPRMLQRAESVHVYGYVVKPVSEKNLIAAVQIAYARWKDMYSTHQELDKTKENLKNQKLISQARSIIQDRLGISAGEAHKRLLQESMQRQTTPAQIAQRIIEKIKK